MRGMDATLSLFGVTWRLGATLFFVALNGFFVAAVADEHGTVVGLAFREDTLEEIVGFLGDEFDDQIPMFKTLGPSQFEMRGQMSLPEACRCLELTLEDQEEEGQDAIGGYVTARLRRMARTGDQVDVGPYQATVVEVARRRIQRLRLDRREADDDSENPEETAGC